EEIIYKDGDRITGKEKVIRIEVVAGATCNFISDFCFWVSTDGTELILDTKKALSSFLLEESMNLPILNEAPVGPSLPDKIFFVLKRSHTSCGDLKKHYEKVLPKVEINVLAAFNAKYPKFCGRFPNGIQGTDSKKTFYYAIFVLWPNSFPFQTNYLVDGWGSGWWFPGAIQ
ncbi:MAG: hypothetical protein RI945_78, partial [Candidatus Parcubacteria bacterium]